MYFICGIFKSYKHLLSEMYNMIHICSFLYDYKLIPCISDTRTKVRKCSQFRVIFFHLQISITRLPRKETGVQSVLLGYYNSTTKGLGIIEIRI